MAENCGIKAKGAAYGIILTDDKNNGGKAIWEKLRLQVVLNMVKFLFILRM